MSTTVVSPIELETIASASPSDLLTASSAKESHMRTPFSVVRTFVMTFLILAGSLAAVFASPGPPHDLLSASI